MWLAAAILWLGSPGEPSPVDLRWETVTGCPDRTIVGTELERLLGPSLRGDGVRASGQLTGAPGAYRLRLEVVAAGQREVRELAANDCTVLSRAGVLVVAVTLDALTAARVVDTAVAPIEAVTPEAVEPVGTVEPVEAAEPGNGALVPEPTSIEPATDDEPRRRTSSSRAEDPERSRRSPRARGATLGAGAGVSGGLTPGLAGGLEGELQWRLGSVRLAAAGFHWFSRSLALEPGIGVEAALSGGSLRGCVAFERARLEVPLCAGLDLAAMHGGGVGSIVRRREARDLWVGVAAGAGILVWVSARFALWARADAVLSARRPAMVLRIEGEPVEAFRMDPVGTRLLVGPIVRLW